MSTPARTFRRLPAHRGYMNLEQAQVDHDRYERLSKSGNNNIVQKLTVPKQSGLAFEVKEGQTCRVVMAYGPQVGDVNIWNLHDPKERFYSGKTRQIHRTHLTQYDRLWSNMPYLRPMATITQDSLKDYGFDEKGMNVHDVIGTRCDPYIQKLMTSNSKPITSQNTPALIPMTSCHTNLMSAIASRGLTESDVHDVFNIFMCSGFDPVTHEYLIRGTPGDTGDYIEFLAEFDLLVALSACPQGDVSHVCGDAVADESCFPLDVLIGQPEKALVHEWRGKRN